MYRGISDFRKGYQPRTNIVKNEKGDLVADSHRIMARWRNHFSQLLNVHEVNVVRQTETHTAEPLEPELSAFDFELAIEKLKSHRSPGTAQIPALLKQGVKKFALRSIKLLILFGIRRKYVRSGRSRSQYLSIIGGIKQTVVIFYFILLFPITTKCKILSSILLSLLTPYAEEIIGDHQYGF